MDYLKYIFEDISRNCTPGQIFWGIVWCIVGAYTTRILDKFFGLGKSILKKRLIERIIDFSGAITYLFSALSFAFIYIFNFNELLTLPIIGPYLSVNGLIKLFLLGWGAIVFAYIFGSIRKIIGRETSLNQTLVELSKIILGPLLLVIFLIYLKVLSELWRGYNWDQIESSNKIFKDHIFLIIKAIMISGGFLFVNSIVEFIKSIYHKNTKTE